MSITISSRKFNQDVSGAKKATKQGPVFITDRGHTAHVLLSYEDYEKLAGGLSLLDAIAKTGDAGLPPIPERGLRAAHRPTGPERVPPHRPTTTRTGLWLLDVGHA